MANRLNLSSGQSTAFMMAVLSELDGVTMGVRMEELRRVHWAEARLIGGFKKFDNISQNLRDVLHWL